MSLKCGFNMAMERWHLMYVERLETRERNTDCNSKGVRAV